MKRFLLTTAALISVYTQFPVSVYSADMPAKAAALNSYAAASDGWTGIYLGVQAGYGNASVNSKWFTYDESNWLAGGHIGYNYRMGNLVVGVETDAMLGGWKELGWVGSTALRAGVLLNENLLAYGAAGVVYGRLDSKLADLSFTGWRAGGGLEYNLTKHLSVRTEYRYMDIEVATGLPHAIVHAGLGGLSVKW